MAIIEDEVRLRREVEDLEDEVRDLERQRHDPTETDQFDRPILFHGWYWPPIGAILALLALVGYNLYNHQLVGKVWPAVSRRFDHLDHAWWVALVAIFIVTLVLTVAIGFNDHYSSRVQRVRMNRALGWGAILLLAVGIFCSTTPTSASKASSVPTCPKGAVLAGGKCSDPKAIAMAVFGPMGWQPGEIKVGNEVPFNDHTEVRGSAAFSGKTLRSHKDIADFLAANPAARARVLSALPKDEQSRALDGSGYVPVWFAVPAQWFGTTYHVGGQVLTEDQARSVPAHDILWLFIRKDGIPVLGASIRADCGNPNFRAIVPVRPNTPPAPPINQPPCTHNCQPPPPQSVKCPNGGATTDRATPCVNLNGPQKQPLQDNNPAQVAPSAGCGSPGCMQNIEQQQQPPPDGGPIMTPNPYGTNTGCQGCNTNDPGTDNGQNGSTGGTPDPNSNQSGTDHGSGDPGGF